MIMDEARHRQQADFSQMSNAYTNVHVPEDHGGGGDDCWDPFAYDIHGNRIHHPPDNPVKK